MTIVLVLLQLRQKRSECSLRVPNKPEVNLRAASKLFPAKIDLHDGRVLRKELLIREVRSNHQQRFAIHHRVIAGRESEQPRHAHVKGVVVLDEPLSAHGLNDGSVYLARQLDQLSVSSG